MSFPQFRLLPPELQLRIWTLSLPAPRVVDLFAVPVSESLQPRFALPAASSPPSPSSSENVTRPVVRKWIRTFLECIYTTPQDLGCLHICTDARRAVLERYAKVNADVNFRSLEMLGGEVGFECLDPVVGRDGEESMFCLGILKGQRPYGILDPERDILFLQDPPQMRDRTGGYIISSLEILLRWFPRPVVQSARKLAIPYYTWRKTKNANKLGLLMRFGALEELWVCFLGDGARRRMWSDFVGGSVGSLDMGGLWSHVREVEEEVRADVDGLKRRFEAWKVPRVRVVRDRRLLVEDLEG